MELSKKIWILHVHLHKQALFSFTMTQRFYLDTSIWRDYYENRRDNFRPLGEWAFKLIQFFIDKEYVVLYSDMVIQELSIAYSPQKIIEIFSIISEQNLLLKVEISENQIKEAMNLANQRKISYGDCLHAILARDNQSTIICRDKHFLELIDLVPIKKPEDLI